MKNEMQQPEFDQEKLDHLNEFAAKFRDLKNYLIGLNLKAVDNVRIAMEHLDDGYLRAREAIFSFNPPDEVPTDPQNPKTDETPTEATLQ